MSSQGISQPGHLHTPCPYSVWHVLDGAVVDVPGNVPDGDGGGDDLTRPPSSDSDDDDIRLTAGGTVQSASTVPTQPQPLTDTRTTAHTHVMMYINQQSVSYNDG